MMDAKFILGLLHNIALLLAAGIIFDYYWKQSERKGGIGQELQIGLLLAGVGIVIMATPWQLSEGMVFDARSVLLSVSGLFFGLVPTLVAMIVTALFRIWTGGPGVWMGVMVILTASMIGISWNKFRPRWRESKSANLEIWVMGVVVHLVMLLCIFFLPARFRYNTFIEIVLPTLFIYPLGTFLFGFFLLHRLNHWKTKALLMANEERFRLFYEKAPVSYHSLDRDGRIRDVNNAWLSMLGYERDEVMGRFLTDFIAPGFVDFWRTRFDEYIGTGTINNVEFSLLRKDGEPVVVASNGRVSYDEQGRFVRTHTVVHNITEQKRYNERINKLNERLTIAAKAARFGVWDWDLATNRLEWDDKMFELHDKKREDFEYAYDAWLSAIHPDEVRLSNEISKKACAGEQEYDTEFRIITGDGSVRLIRALGMVIRDNSGQPVRMTGINYDITERRRDEEALREAHHQLEIITTHIPNILWKADVATDGSFINTYISPVVDEFLHLPANSINHQWDKFFSYTDPFYRQSISDLIKNGATHPGETISMEYLIHRDDGTSAWFLSSGRAFINQGALRIFGFTTDITERKLADQKLRESEELFRSYIENAPDGIFISDRSGNLHDINLATCNLTGYSSEELLAMNGEKLLPKGYFHSGNSFVDHVLATGHCNEETFFIHKNGTEIPVLISAVEISEKRVLAFVKNIDSIKQTQNELIKAKEKAEESDQLKSAFLATMSHELRTPLNAIIGFSSLIDEETDLDTIYENAQIVNRSGEHLLAIIESIFEIALLQSGKITTKPSLFKAANLLEELSQMAEVEKKDKEKHTINIVVSPDCKEQDLTLRADFSKLMQLMGNLINNAIKYTLSGEVVFGYTKTNTDLTFFVKDTGIGIPADKIDIIFEQFRQIDESNTRIHGGVGLGLSICKEIVTLFDGSITVESTVGQGSTFWVYIPNIVAHTEKEEVTNKKTIAPKKFEGKTILLVDDLDDNLFLLDFMLVATGVATLTATGGQQAIDLVAAHPEIDLVLMDIKMPDMDGYEATQEIHRIRPNLPVVAQTAFAMPGDREMALNQGCIAYLAKPIKRKELFQLIADIFEINQ